MFLNLRASGGHGPLPNACGPPPGLSARALRLPELINRNLQFARSAHDGRPRVCEPASLKRVHFSLGDA
jgi:hypothetical protein